MDARRLSFLEAVAGPDGAHALAKAVAHRADLEWALVPRAIMSWVAVAGETGFSGVIPGTAEGLTLRKAETGYDFVLGLYADRGASLERVAAAVAVALGADADAPPPLRSPALAKLGKSVDLLVRARALRKALQRRPAKPVALPGTAAKPIAPEAATPPQATEDEQPGEPRADAPVAAKKPRQIKVTKAEAAARCQTCQRRFFVDDVFVGCDCFEGIAKSVRTHRTLTGYTLTFGGLEWDAETVATLAESFGK